MLSAAWTADIIVINVLLQDVYKRQALDFPTPDYPMSENPISGNPTPEAETITSFVPCKQLHELPIVMLRSRGQKSLDLGGLQTRKHQG